MLGHEEAETPIGVNCDLRSYQQQSLKWCLDQEQLPVSIYIYLCIYIGMNCHVHDSNTHVHICTILIPLLAGLFVTYNT